MMDAIAKDLQQAGYAVVAGPEMGGGDLHVFTAEDDARQVALIEGDDQSERKAREAETFNVAGVVIVGTGAAPKLGCPVKVVAAKNVPAAVRDILG